MLLLHDGGVIQLGGIRFLNEVISARDLRGIPAQEVSVERGGKIEQLRHVRDLRGIPT